MQFKSVPSRFYFPALALLTLIGLFLADGILLNHETVQSPGAQTQAFCFIGVLAALWAIRIPAIRKKVPPPVEAFIYIFILAVLALAAGFFLNEMWALMGRH